MPFAASYGASIFAGNNKKNKAIEKAVVPEGNKTVKGEISFCELGHTHVRYRKSHVYYTESSRDRRRGKT